MSPTPEMDGRVVLVTGGTRGIGRAIAEVFLGAGAGVALCARKDPDDLPSVGGRSASYFPCDVRDAEQVDALVTAVTARHGRLDVLINNAGGTPWADAATASPRLMAAVIDLNLTAPLVVSQRANRVMQEQDGGGVIVNIASVSGTRPSPGTAAYGAAKAGLLNLTRSLAVEWGPKVRVNAVTAGIVATELVDVVYGDEAQQERIAETVPLRRFGQPDDVAQACLFLASERASYITGTHLVVDGGGERGSIGELD